MGRFTLSAHIGYLFTERALTGRLAAAREAGFDAVEHPAPYAIPAAELKALLNGEGLSFSQLASPMGDTGKGEKGLAALAGRQSEFRDGFARALDYAEAIDCPFVHPMAGVTADPDAAKVLDDNLAFAIEACRHRHPAVLIEAIGAATVPGYVLNHPQDSVRLAERFGGAVKILFDTFHAASCGVDGVDFIARHGAYIGHVHAADYPGRHEPGSGALDFSGLLDALADTGFGGAIGFEYLPAADTQNSLSWMKAWRAHRHH